MEDQNFTRTKEIKKSLADPTLLRPVFKVRPIRYHKSAAEKSISHYLKTTREKSLQNKIDFKDEISKLFITLNDIQVLPEKILTLNCFQSFEACHVLVHEKGKPIAQNYFAQYNKYEPVKPLTVPHFNTLFNLVKKSKNKIFNQTVNLKEDLSILGHFLAKEIDLKTHSVIYLISRNSFIPPTNEEQDDFQLLSLFLPPLLLKILDKGKNDSKKDILKKTLEHFPERITVKDHINVLFTNKNSEISKEQENLLLFPLDSISNIVMELSNFSKDQISTELYHSQRIALLGELLNTLQHELSNPLFGLNLTSTILRSEVNNDETEETLRDIALNAARSQTIIKNFSNLYSNNEEVKSIDIYQFIEEVITLTKSETKEIQKKIVCVGFDKADGLKISTNPTCLTQIIFNLIINAAQALKSHQMDRMTSSITVQIQKESNHITLSVIDNGPGIKNEHLETIFKPFFTTKDYGTGLGLSICQNLASQLDSKIQFQNNSPFAGATFSINLPIK